MGMWNKLASSMLIAALLLTGCGGKDVPAPAEQAQKRPPLEVPASFASNEEKREFAIQAVNQGYYAEVKSLLEQAINEAPTAAAYSSLGTVKYQEDDFAGAMEAWQKAGELDPEITSEMITNVGNALRDSGKPKEAMDAYRNALEQQPGSVHAAANLAVLLRTEGKTAEAVEVLEQTAEANPAAAQLADLASNWKKELQNSNQGS